MNDYNYKSTDSGKFGKAFERDLKAEIGRQAVVSAQGKVDLRKAHKNYEIKTGAGELGEAGGKLLRGVSMIVYVPVVNESLPVTSQEGFILRREIFLQCLEDCDLIRHKISTSGQEKVTIQTFWNKKTGKPHGNKYFKLIDSLYENCEATLEEWFEG